MSVLIKGMAMPKSCDDCDFARHGITDWCYVTEKDIPCDCPIVPIPPHGDLIDRDALAKMCQEMQSIEWNNKAAPYSWAYAYESFESDIDNAPTIIPAEEGE